MFVSEIVFDPCFVPSTQQPPPPWAAGDIRRCYGKRWCKPASFPDRRPCVVPVISLEMTRAQRIYLSASRLVALVKRKQRLSLFSPWIPHLRIFANALAGCAGGTNSGLFHATRSRALSSPLPYYRRISITPTFLPSRSAIRSPCPRPVHVLRIFSRLASSPPRSFVGIVLCRNGSAPRWIIALQVSRSFSYFF